jgi:hypothetical protein
MSKSIVMSNYKIVKESDKLNFVSITLEEETGLLIDGYRKISDENFSFVYNNDCIIAKHEKIKSIQKVDVVMAKTYITQPFFNISTKFEHFFGPHNSQINIFIGESDESIVRHIDRTTQTTGAPRIYVGPEYKFWAEQNFVIGEIMTVEVFSNASIRLSKKLI